MKNMSHRYAAILAADVAGYSRLMESDSEATVLALKDCRRTFQRCVAYHQGREFGSVGDSLMAEFQSPVEALRAAKEIQSTLSGDGRIVIRIGLHAGDVISDGDSLFGDVVNTAARLQQLAEPGGIAVSGLVYDQVHKERGFAFHSLGRQPLKNIAEPVRAYAVHIGTQSVNWQRVRLAWPKYKTAAAATIGVIFAGALIIAYLESQAPGIGGVIQVPTPDSNSIAVMAFDALSEGINDEDFTEAVSAEVQASLARIDGIKVSGWRSSFYYKGRNEDLRKIGAALGVAHVLEGSLWRSGDDLRISAQIIQTSDGFSIWSQTYDRSTADIFAIQSDIASDVARALGVPVVAARRDAPFDFGTTNAEARSLYLVAMARLKRDVSTAHPTPIYDVSKQTRQILQGVVTLDPEYAEAWAALARAYVREVSILPETEGEFVTRSDGIEAANNALDKATALKPNMPDTLLAQAELSAATFHSRGSAATDREAVLSAFEEAVAAAPDDPDVLMSAAAFNHVVGRLDRAVQLYDRILIIEPLSEVRLSRAQALGPGDLVAKYQEFLRVAELHPESNWRETLAYFEMGVGHYHHALFWSEPLWDRFLLLPFIWASLGDTEHALRIIGERRRTAGPIAPLYPIYDFRIKGDYAGLHEFFQSEEARESVESLKVTTCGLDYAALFFSRQWDEAAVARDECLATTPAEIQAIARGTPEGRAHGLQLRSFMKLLRSHTIATAAYTYERVGRTIEAEAQWEWAAELLESANPEYMMAIHTKMHYQALIDAGRGRKAAAIDRLEALYDTGWRGPLMGATGFGTYLFGDWGWFEDNPMFDSIRDEPRFKALVDRVKADNAHMLAQYRAGLNRDDIVTEDLRLLAQYPE